VLLAPDPTPYDLRWRMFGVRIRVHPLFWVVAALLGFEWSKVGFPFLLLWVACVFVSVLWHELGHVFMGRLFGSPGHIVLFSFGGLAIGSGDVPRRYQRVLVSAAGPLAQLLLLVPIAVALNQIDGVPFGWEMLIPYRGEEAAVLGLKMLAQINLFWPLLNLLPIWPLDGGQITREVCEGASEERGRVVSLGISAAVSGVLAAHVLLAMQGHPLIPGLEWLSGLYMGIFFALFCVSSFQALQAEKSRRRPGGWDDDLPPWER
jgi:Zn-dependent protease